MATQSEIRERKKGDWKFTPLPNEWTLGDSDYPVKIYAPDNDDEPTITIYVGPLSQTFAAEYTPENTGANSTTDSPFKYGDLDEIAKWVDGKIQNHTEA